MWPHIVNLIGFLIRLYLIITISAQDNYYEGDYNIFTDLDYKVYLDASLYDNPYDRHTFRYSPILSFLMSPSYTLHQNFGKIIIALFDVIACYFIPKLFERRKFRSAVQNKKLSILATVYYSVHPLGIYITIRGNCEGIIMAFIFAFMYFFFSDQAHGSMSAYQRRDRGIVQRQPDKIKRYISYIIFGLAVHFRIFPIIFVPLLIMYEYHSVKENQFKHAFKFALEFGLIAGGVFLALAFYFYRIYGYTFIYETYIYHLFRKDLRHSHSAYFYEIYLNFETDSLVGSASRSISRLLPWIITFCATFFTFVKYYNIYVLFAILTFSFVQFNKVINLQYFIWVEFFFLVSFNKLDLKISTLKGILIEVLRGFKNHIFVVPTVAIWQIVLNKLCDLQKGYTIQSIWIVCLLTNLTHVIGFCLEISKLEPYKGLQSEKKAKLPAIPRRPLQIYSKKRN